MTVAMSTTTKTKTPKAPKLFPDELVDQLLAQIQNKDAESILGESGLAGLLKKQLGERMLAAKYQRRLPAFDDNVISTYARGMSVREIQGHLQQLYGLKVSPDLISTIHLSPRM